MERPAQDEQAPSPATRAKPLQKPGLPALPAVDDGEVDEAEAAAATELPEQSFPTPGLDREDKLTRGEYAPGEGHGLTRPAPAGAATSRPDYRTELAFSQRQLIGMSGSFLIVLAVFLPVISMPVIGTLSLFSATPTAGVLLLGAGGYGFFAAVRNDFRYVQWVGALAGVVVTLAFLYLLRGIGGVNLEEGDPLGIAQILEQGVNYMWGWAVLLAGATLLLFSGRVRDEFRVKRRGAERTP